MSGYFDALEAELRAAVPRAGRNPSLRSGPGHVWPGRRAGNACHWDWSVR